MTKEPKVDVKVTYNGIDPKLFGTLNDKGQEILDPVPMAPPVGYTRQPTMTERLRNMIHSEQLRIAAAEMGAETFEESEDFDVDDDDYDPQSPWEEQFDPIDDALRMELRQREFAANYNARMERARARAGVAREDVYGSNADKGRKEDRSRSNPRTDRDKQSERREDSASRVQDGLRSGGKSAAGGDDED